MDSTMQPSEETELEATEALPVVVPAGVEVRERVIPLRSADLTKLVVNDPGLSPAERISLGRFCKLLGATFHQEFYDWLQELKDLYAPLDPDSDCVRVPSVSPASTPDQDERFLKAFESTLIRANYRRLNLAVIEEAIESPNELGLNYVPDFELFSQLRIYVRGQTRVTRTVRNIRTRFRRESVHFDGYQRLIVALRFKPRDKKLGPFARSDVLYLRMYKDVPHVDMEMHLPEQGTRVKMRMIDKAQIASPLVVGLPTFAFKLLFASLISPVAVGGVLVAPITAGLNSFFGFQRAKQRHLHHMIRNLYYLNLASNASVIKCVIDSAEDEEYKEALLAYFLLWRHLGDAEPWSRTRLDEQIEAWLRELCPGKDTDFEVGDALNKLIRLGLVRISAQGHLLAVPIESALTILDARWDDLFPYNRPTLSPDPVGSHGDC